MTELMPQTTLPFTAEHDEFRAQVRQLCETEVAPNAERWLRERMVDREFFNKMGEQGMLCTWVDPKYGGRGGDMLYPVILIQEIAGAGYGCIGYWLHSDISTHYIDVYGTEEQKAHYLPKFVSGEKLLCLALTEKDFGSNLAAIQTQAVKDGDEYVITGTKIYMTNGMLSDVALVAAVTDPEAGSRGISMFVVDLDGAEGFSRKKLDKIGMHMQDTAELTFDGVRVPASALLGEEGKAYGYILSMLQGERTIGAQLAQAQGERALKLAVERARSRAMFGRTLADMQHTQFLVAEMQTKLAAGRALADQVVLNRMSGAATTSEVSMAKLYCTEVALWAADKNLQIWGGQGYAFDDSEAGNLFVDLRGQTMAAGTSEVMKLIIGGTLFPKPRKK